MSLAVLKLEAERAFDFSYTEEGFYIVGHADIITNERDRIDFFPSLYNSDLGSLIDFYFSSFANKFVKDHRETGSYRDFYRLTFQNEEGTPFYFSGFEGFNHNETFEVYSLGSYGYFEMGGVSAGLYISILALDALIWNLYNVANKTAKLSAIYDNLVKQKMFLFDYVLTRGDDTGKLYRLLD